MDVAVTADGGDSAYSIPEDLRRNSLLGRFPAETEARYRTWYVEQAKPLIRIIVIPSIAVWVLMPFLFDFWVDTLESDMDVYVMSWAVATPTLVAVLAISYTRLQSIQFPAAVLGLLIIAGLSFNGFYSFVSEPMEAGLFGTMIWLTALIPFTRTPFRTTTFLTVVILGVGSGYLVASVRELDTPRDQTWPYAAMIFIVGICVPLMALASEQALRKRYVDEQIIERQRAEITASRELIRRYAPASVVDLLEHGDHTVGTAQRRRVTVFFADVVGFTTMADRLDPEALAEIMNDYLGAVADLVEGHGGTVNEFAGDGVMAIFGAPGEMDPVAQVQAALATGRELQATLPRLSLRWYSLGIDQDLRARIGINTGVVSVGTFGSSVRATYTGIGLQTNIAARIQAFCPPGSVLLSNTSWHLIKDVVPCEPRGEVEVKGVHFPIAMYEPTGAR